MHDWKTGAKTLFKRVLYRGLVPGTYRVGSLRGVRPGSVLAVEMMEPKPTSNLVPVMEGLEREGLRCAFLSLGNNRLSKATYALRCVRMAWDASTAQLILVCDGCLPVAALPLRPQTKVVQLWHACGAFKKFGKSTADKIFGDTSEFSGKLSRYRNTSLVTVSSPEVVWAYEEAMGLEGTGAVQALGVARTDAFFDQAQLAAWRQEALAAVPALAGRRVLLYAPTFRGHVVGAQAPDFLDLALLKERLGEDWAVLVKHHPFVRDLPPVPAGCEGFAFDVTRSLPIEAAMAVADACVTDYSSLVFEWSLLERPVAFLAPDLANYDDWRGFYYDYDAMTPGPVLSTTGELADWAATLPAGFDGAELAVFRKRFMASCDGHAAQRVVAAILGEDNHFTLGGNPPK